MGDPSASLGISARGSDAAQAPQVRFSSLLPSDDTQVIELEGFEIEVASEVYCNRGGDHRELVDRARTDRKRLGHNVDESAVLCVRCMKAIALKA